jgi:hypothetical protein
LAALTGFGNSTIISLARASEYQRLQSINYPKFPWAEFYRRRPRRRLRTGTANSNGRAVGLKNERVQLRLNESMIQFVHREENLAE